jgi:hypothetical protein
MLGAIGAMRIPVGLLSESRDFTGLVWG